MFNNVIKHNNYLFVSTESGDAPGHIGDAFGLYLGDTRVLSRYTLQLEPGNLNVTASSMRAGDSGRIVLLADEINSLHSPRREVVIERRPIIRDGFVERISVSNYGWAPCQLQLVLQLAADFRDMFEVRGMLRDGRGRLFLPEIAVDGVQFRYRGLDEMEYVTDVRFAPASAGAAPLDLHIELEEASPSNLIADNVPAVRVALPLVVEPRGHFAFEVSVVATIGTGGTSDSAPPPPGTSVGHISERRHHASAVDGSRRDWSEWSANSALWRTDNAAVNEILDQSLRDIRMLSTDFGFGLMPTAGVPWYAAPFGRDSLVTSVQTLSIRPDIAAATLRTLARWQGTRYNPHLDEAPGKIMHELRSGELARTGEIPYIPYYGTVDATPLFIIAAREYWRWTGDMTLIRELLPALHAAARWLDQYGDLDGDGYIEYHRLHEGGLTNQGWKDSVDGIVDQNGCLAEPPIALAEVQGYVYAARRYFADLLEACGDVEAAAEQRRRGHLLKVAFNRDFWVDEIGFYAMALDRHKRPIAAVSSNPGHCLWSGIIARERADAVAQTLLSDDMFTGYGIRTLSAAEPAYHPLSYHRGTVWPHDNSLIAMGLARSGHGAAAARIAAGLFRAASFDRNRRLPELFGGYPADIDGPVWYPVACIPHAWAAAAPFLLLQATLGLEPDVPHHQLTLSPHLPKGINRVELSNLTLGERRVHIVVERRGHTDDFEWNVEVLSGQPLTVVAKR